MEQEVIFEQDYGPEGIVDLLDDIGEHMYALEEGGTYRVRVEFIPD